MYGDLDDYGRLPPDESVHLGGIVLTEVFTPSTVSRLSDAIGRLRQEDRRQWEDVAENLKRSRGATSPGGWQYLGVVRRPGDFLPGNGFYDRDLPQTVDAVWLTLHHLTPSLTILVATFTLKESFGDLSVWLRQDQKGHISNMQVVIPGRFGKLRAKIPWARPKDAWASYSLDFPSESRRREYERISSQLEIACWKWLAVRFSGRFSALGLSKRHACRILLTTKASPADKDSDWLQSVGISSTLGAWVADGEPRWIFDERPLSPLRADVRSVFAIRRSDAAAFGDGGDVDGQKWVITQQFHQNHSPLVARLAALHLLSVYRNALSELRDQSGKRRKLTRPVTQARSFDAYLMQDGLDSSTISSELLEQAMGINRFRAHVIDYHYRSPGEDDSDPGSLISGIYSRTERTAERLLKDSDTTTANIRASAELRQAIANTRLQRVVLIIGIFAAIISVISLIVAVKAN